MMSERARYSCSDVLTRKGCEQTSTATTLPWTTVEPKRSAWARISAIRSGPRIPFLNPGKFSTSVVSISCPPASMPSINNGCRLALAVYSAAVSPAGPDPMMITFRMSDMGKKLDVLVDHFFEVFLLGKADDRLYHLASLEQQQC